MSATNSEEYTVAPIGGGFGNMKACAVTLTIETYTTGGVAIDHDTSGYKVLSVISDKAEYTPKAVRQADGSIKVLMYELSYTADPAGVSWGEVSATTDVGDVTIWMVGV